MNTLRCLAFGCALLSLSGCGGRGAGDEAARPRPVTVMELRETDPRRLDRISGTVASWKTEDIGFEVEGRVEYVVEPDTDIEGRVLTTDNRLLRKPTELARLDKTRYELRLTAAQARLESYSRQKAAVKIEANELVDAEIDAALAEEKKAKDDYVKYRAAYERKAVTESELKAAEAKRDQAVAQVAQLKAKKEAKKAEVTSLDAQMKQAEQDRREAETNLKDCVLFSPFRGRVSKVHVIPGGYVMRGQPVLTVQMMVPIKVEFEVSAETDRRISYEDTIPVYVTDSDGQQKQVLGTVYQKSPTADPATRTYSVTLILQNERLKPVLPKSFDENRLARTSKLWALQFTAPDYPGYYVIDDKAIHRDDKGPYVWKVTNRTLQTASSRTDPILKVEKLRVTQVEQRASILGLFTLTPIKVNDESQFTRGTDLIVGELFPKAVADSFDGGAVLLDRSRWLLRPGDVVSVDVSGKPQTPGFYVPINAIRRDADRASVFVAKPKEGGGLVARRIDVRTSKGPGTFMRVEPIGDQSLTDGMSLIVDGAHYLVDGEDIAVSKRIEVRR